jgi:hypothetical protein
MDTHPRYYRALREVNKQVGTLANEIRSAYLKFDNLIGSAVLADTYMLIGRMNSGGTVSEAGLLIGTEMFGRPKKDFDRRTVGVAP